MEQLRKEKNERLLRHGDGSESLQSDFGYSSLPPAGTGAKINPKILDEVFASELSDPLPSGMYTVTYDSKKLGLKFEAADGAVIVTHCIGPSEDYVTPQVRPRQHNPRRQYRDQARSSQRAAPIPAWRLALPDGPSVLAFSASDLPSPCSPPLPLLSPRPFPRPSPPAGHPALTHLPTYRYRSTLTLP